MTDLLFISRVYVAVIGRISIIYDQYIPRECSSWKDTVLEFSQFMGGGNLCHSNANADKQQICRSTGTG